MTSQDAAKQIAASIETLKTVRDALGEQLCRHSGAGKQTDADAQRLTDLHDRAARAVAAYYQRA